MIWSFLSLSLFSCALKRQRIFWNRFVSLFPILLTPVTKRKIWTLFFICGGRREGGERWNRPSMVTVQLSKSHTQVFTCRKWSYQRWITTEKKETARIGIKLSDGHLMGVSTDLGMSQVHNHMTSRPSLKFNDLQEVLQVYVLQKPDITCLLQKKKKSNVPKEENMAHDLTSWQSTLLGSARKKVFFWGVNFLLYSKDFHYVTFAKPTLFQNYPLKRQQSKKREGTLHILKWCINQ